MLVVGKIEAVEEERVDDITKEDFGQRVLTIGRIEELLHGFVGEREEFIASQRRLEVFDLLLNP